MTGPAGLRTALLLMLLPVILGMPAAAQPGAPPVVTSLTVNGGVVSEAWAGWPLLLRADVLHAQAFAPDAAPISVGGAGGPWTDGLRLTVRDAEGEVVPLTPHLAGAPEGTLVLDAQQSGTAVWVLTPEESAALAPGTYTFELVLLAAALGGGHPDVASVPATLTVRSPGEAPTPEQVVRRALLLADLHTLQNRPSDAAAVVEAVLADAPEHPEALTAQGRMLLAAGDARAAADVLSRAAAAYDVLSPQGGRAFSAVTFLLGRAEQTWMESTTFEVTVADKGSNHPHADRGGTLAYAIDGIPGAELVLKRGTTYTFRLADVPASHPFYLTASSEGAGAAPYTVGLDGAPAAGSRTVTFSPDAHTPDVLYYGCTVHPFMGWRLHVAPVRGTSVGTEPPPGPDAAPGTGTLPPEGFTLSAAYPNPFSRSTTIEYGVPEPTEVRLVVYDLLGRVVAVLADGPVPAGRYERVLEATDLPAGAYLVRMTTGEGFAETRHLTLVR